MASRQAKSALSLVCVVEAIAARGVSSEAIAARGRWRSAML